MSAERDELMRLVKGLPDAQVPQVLDNLRRHLQPGQDQSWPPAWFGSAEGDGMAIGARSDELRSEGFGR